MTGGGTRFSLWWNDARWCTVQFQSQAFLVLTQIFLWLTSQLATSVTRDVFLKSSCQEEAYEQAISYLSLLQLRISLVEFLNGFRETKLGGPRCKTSLCIQLKNNWLIWGAKIRLLWKMRNKRKYILRSRTENKYFCSRKAVVGHPLISHSSIFFAWNILSWVYIFLQLLSIPSNQTQLLIKICLILTDAILSLTPPFRVIYFGGLRFFLGSPAIISHYGRTYKRCN